LATHSFYLDESELAALSLTFTGPLPRPDGEAMLGRSHSIDNAPYLVHTNFELPLMLDGRKPFAAFLDQANSEAIKTIRTYFRQYVEANAIAERSDERAASLDRRHGASSRAMLGYTEQQCEWWIVERSRRKAISSKITGSTA
jgi:hypothetical protein